jgi:Spy/CpxP family protein refolding chaperone
MNQVLKWKLIAGFLLVFVAGGITGMALGGLYARHLFFEFHRPGRMGDRMKERLRTELSLTSEQVATISPIVDKTAARLQEIRRDTGRRVHEIMIETDKEIAVNLTDEQRQKLQQIEERHRQGWRHRYGPHEFPPESPPATPSNR